MLRNWSASCSALAIALTLSSHEAAADEGVAVLSWRVVNRFPLLPDARFAELDADWRSGRLAPKTQPSVHAFVVSRMLRQTEAQASNPLISTPKELASTYLNGRYAPAYLQPPSDLPVEIEVVLTKASAAPCVWTLPSEAAMVSQSHCKVVVRVPLRRTASISVAHGDMHANVSVRVREVLIGAMGDSFASGEGSPDIPSIFLSEVPQGNDWFTRNPVPSQSAQWLDAVCHRSLVSWPMLAALRLAMEHEHARVTIINHSCSGAELMDGLYLAQRRPPGQAHLTVVDAKTRDGIGPRYLGASDGHDKFVRRSQINALREDLCADPLRGIEPVDIDGDRYVAAIGACEKFKMRLDAVLLSIGGNDVGFGPSVKGVLVPSATRFEWLPMSFFAQSGLNFMRSQGKVISVKEMHERIKNATRHYEARILRIAKDVGVHPNQTVLLAYPDVIGGDDGSCVQPDRANRIKYANMAFAPLARHFAPTLAHPFMMWAAEVSPAEVRAFRTEAFPALRAMQLALRTHGVRVADFLQPGQPQFAGRLVCTDAEGWPSSVEAHRQWELEPFFFCLKRSNSDPDQCTTPGGPNRAFDFQNRSLGTWKPLAPGRRVVNTVNDALLIQREVASPGQDADELLMAAASGGFHPIAEAQALAADNAYPSLCAALNSTRIANNPNEAVTASEELCVH